MNFCSKCGHELKQQDLYCAECGEKVQKQAVAEPSQAAAGPAALSTDDHTEETQNPPGNLSYIPPRKRMSRAVKLLIAFAVVLAVALAGGYYAGTAVFSPDRTIQAFQQAVEDGDTAKLKELLRPASEGMGADEQDIARLAEYYRAHESNLEAAVRSLRSQADKDGQAAESELKLVKQGKKLLIYDQYLIEVPPYYVTLHTNMEDTDLFINGDRVDTAGETGYSKRFGPFWPGEHQVEAVFTGEFTTLKQSQDVSLYEEQEQDIHLEIDASYVQFKSEINEAEVFVNGESTGRTVSEFDGTIGPVTFDGQITLHAEAEFPWGTFRSEDIVLTPELENATVSFLFEEAHSAAREQVMEAVNDFLASWVPAYENRDITLFTNITEERRSLFASDFQWMLETGQRFTADIVGTEFDLDSFMLDGGYDGYPYSAVIDVAYVLGNAAWYYEGEEPQLDDMISFIQYELVYDDTTGRWIISYFTSLDGIDFTNTQAFTYE